MALLAVLLLAWPSLAGAAPAEGGAREHYRKGMAMFALQKWDEAIKEFEAGFSDEQRPAFLFNIAQSHLKAGRPALAVKFFHTYLELDPSAKDRKQVEDTIQKLERELAEARTAPPATTAITPPATTATTPPATTTVTVPAASPSATISPIANTPPAIASASQTEPSAPSPSGKVEKEPSSSSVPTAALQATPAPEKPKRKMWPIWVGVAAGVVVVGAAVTAGVLLSRPSEPVLMPWSL